MQAIQKSKELIHNIYSIFRKELTLVAKDEAVLTFFLALTFLYPIVYTYIYSNETVHEVPVAIIDNTNSSESREFIRNWNATSGVNVVAKCRDIEEARNLFYQKEIYGILEIPADFSVNLAKGEQAHVSLFSDMGSLLNYKALLTAASDVSLELGKKIQVKGLEYASVKQEQLTASPVQIKEIKMFNPQSGFASFIIPAILILVIQQSLLLGVGTIAGTARDMYGRLLPKGSDYQNPFAIVSGKALVYLLIYSVVCIWVFIVVPGIFNLTRIGDKGELFLFLVPFLLASIFFAMTLSFLCKEREAPFLLFVFTSVPLMFISGISWPITAIPDYWVCFSKIFPSTYGIEGFVKINNMGATLTEVRAEFIGLWMLAGIYLLFASLLYWWEIRRNRCF